MRNDRTAFGKYQVLARLGQGGMGHVYLAMHAGPAGVQKIMVIKQLREDFAISLAARGMFLDEARIATRLSHPNVVQTIEVVDDDDDLYLVMEFLDGQPLSRILEPAHRDSLTLAAKVRILVEALEGLHYAHELTDYDGRPLNVVHRDVSPQNIVATYDGHVKLVDFGVAKAADAQTVTESGVFKGKVRYASPEQALCTPVDRRADVFAVGTVLWEILAGRRLWQDHADASVLLALASGKIPRVHDAFAGAPPTLEAICNKALEIDPNRRYATALEMRDALLAYLRDQRNERDESDIGRALSASFATERRQLHTVIDAQMRAARETSPGALTVRNIPLLDPSAANALASERSIVRGGLAVESEARSRRPAAAGTSQRGGVSIAIFAVLGVLAVVAGIALLLPSRSRAAAASPAPAAIAAPAERPVHLSLAATPASARFALDGRTLASNPFEGDVPRDDLPHRLTIRADGFASRDVDARFTRDVSVDVTLAELPAPGASAPPASSALAAPATHAAASPAPASPGPPGKASPQRRIDEDDPYKR